MLEKLRIRQNAVIPPQPARPKPDVKDLARRLLRINSTLTSLERALLLRPDDSSPQIDSLYSPIRLAHLASQYHELSYLLTASTPHPFTRALHPRVEKVRTTLTKDFKDAISTSKRDGNSPQVLNYIQLASKTDLKILNRIPPITH
jgi:hypothetical protein